VLSVLTTAGIFCNRACTYRLTRKRHERQLLRLFTFTVSVFVLYKVCQEDVVKLCDCQISNMKKLLEAAFILFQIVLPLSFIWIPFLHGNYGGNGQPWCWIATLNKDCSQNVEGFWEQIGLWYAPVSILGFLIVLSVLTTAGIFCKRACTYRLTRRRHERKAAETIILLIFLLLFGTLAGIEATSNLYFSFTKKQQGYQSATRKQFKAVQLSCCN